ncbi:acetate/propionate family kinase [Dongia soli]|uniref:Acetate kinase n=1 Tax=Dongia soli TaxID=600628 RepID=A0ABU5EG26_9PROT|nr:acetate/propionate family kinase [Dongia soli]MDY0885173.1 acetate/propionate family kinase [Dongia soli]
MSSKDAHDGNKLLVLNAGSSSLKFAIYNAGIGAEMPALLLKGQIAGIGQDRTRLEVKALQGEAPDWPFEADAISTHREALSLLIDRLAITREKATWLGIGHRVVHGGTAYSAPIVITDNDIAALESICPLAPLHQPHNVAAIKALRDLLPDMPQVACFDTGFHADNPERITRFALPERFWRAGIRRYGFHGISYEAILHRLQQEKIDIPSRLVIAHLGNGASMAAIKDGKGIASSMGFSTLEGLVMGTRPGSIDPGVLLHLLHDGMSLGDLEKLLYHQSGLLGLSGISADMKTLSDSKDPAAARAIDLYCHRIAMELARMSAELQGLDMMIFTGGIGENAANIRAAVCNEAAWLGLSLASGANERAAHPAGPLQISIAGKHVRVMVVPTDEEGVIARHCKELISHI